MSINYLGAAMERRGITKEAGLASFVSDMLNRNVGDLPGIRQVRKVVGDTATHFSEGSAHGKYLREFNRSGAAGPPSPAWHAPRATKMHGVGEFWGKQPGLVRWGVPSIAALQTTRAVWPEGEEMSDYEKTMIAAKKAGILKDPGEKITPEDMKRFREEKAKLDADAKKKKEDEGKKSNQWIPGMDNTLTAGAAGGVGGGLAGYMLAKRMGWDPMTSSLVGGVGTATAAAMLASWMKQDEKTTPNK
jgi:hypothetical protein